MLCLRASQFFKAHLSSVAKPANLANMIVFAAAHIQISYVQQYIQACCKAQIHSVRINTCV